MGSPRTGSAPRNRGRRLAFWSALSLGWLLPSVGCQVEYAGMTLPSGKYMHDDVQYFQPGPDFPWANTQAATQRARMQAMGFDPAAATSGPFTPPVPPGALPAIQERGGRIQDVGQSGLAPPAGMQNEPPPPVPAPVPPPPNPAAPAAPTGPAPM